MYGSVCIKHDTLSHKHANKDLFLLTPPLKLICCREHAEGSTEASEACLLTETPLPGIPPGRCTGGKSLGVSL